MDVNTLLQLSNLPATLVVLFLMLKFIENVLNNNFKQIQDELKEHRDKINSLLQNGVNLRLQQIEQRCKKFHGD